MYMAFQSMSLSLEKFSKCLLEKGLTYFVAIVAIRQEDDSLDINLSTVKALESLNDDHKQEF